MITRYTIPVALTLLDSIRLYSVSMLIFTTLFIIASYTVCQLMVENSPERHEIHNKENLFILSKHEGIIRCHQRSTYVRGIYHIHLMDGQLVFMATPAILDSKYNYSCLNSSQSLRKRQQNVSGSYFYRAYKSRINKIVVQSKFSYDPPSSAKSRYYQRPHPIARNQLCITDRKPTVTKATV